MGPNLLKFLNGSCKMGVAVCCFLQLNHHLLLVHQINLHFKTNKTLMTLFFILLDHHLPLQIVVPLGIKASLITVTMPLLMKYPSVSLAASCTLSLLMICNNAAPPLLSELHQRTQFPSNKSRMNSPSRFLQYEHFCLLSPA